ncbi:MAG: helix-turn-helix domain-containing protein [Bacteroidales bacterium]|nr:helix-turn-helix domain-containing protein [Bacteroidales bacterium]
MRNEDYIVIQGWMRSLGLTDKQLLVYAMIWGFSRDGRSRMRGSAKYIAAAAGCSPRHAQRIIYELENLGYIRHEVAATRRGLVSEFWAVAPADIADQGRGSKDRIIWEGVRRGRRNPVTSLMSQHGYDVGVVTPILLSSHSTDSNIKKIRGGGKNSAPGRAKTTTTTTGFLFDNDGSGLAAGEIPSCRLPWEGEALSKAWAMLMKQPAWRRKSPEALAIVCEEIGKYCSYSDAVYLLRLAVKKGWDDIKDPGAIVADDSEHVPQYPDTAWRAVEL